ncbi:hypothetical protein NDU88_001576 [Pleurodeles waltl]|uniref:Uncharacterized protein n=1 Tax=Pleurodeles waltl TaxID=8319 RepID=A0AAV7MK35_PLEWA|nr:hypothetical protein NDU88_001576 [Pleurodeles waltl]
MSKFRESQQILEVRKNAAKLTDGSWWGITRLALEPSVRRSVAESKELGNKSLVRAKQAARARRSPEAPEPQGPQGRGVHEGRGVHKGRGSIQPLSRPPKRSLAPSTVCSLGAPLHKRPDHRSVCADSGTQLGLHPRVRCYNTSPDRGPPPRPK